MRAANAGASFQLYGRYFIVTADHLFTQQKQSPDLDPNSDSEFEFEIPEVECSSSDLTAGDSELDHYPLLSNLPIRDQAISKDELIKPGTVVFSSTDAGNPGLDFSLVEIDQEYSESNDAAIFAGVPDYNAVKRQVTPEPADRYVKAVTASNYVLEGRLSGTPAFIRCSGGVGFQEVWAVRFDGQINQGDSGSLVMGLDGGVIHGHIIAGSPTSGVAYVVPAAQIFNCLDSCIMPQDAVNHPATPPYERKILDIGISPQNVANHPATPPYEREMLDIGWYPQFSRYQNLHDDETLVDFEKVGAGEDHLGIPITDSAATASRCEIEVLEDFCRGISLADVKAGKGTAGHQRIVWIDDRSNSALEGSGDARQYKNPLTATGFFRALEEPRFDHKDFPDARRRLIYITDLSPACILALAETAPLYQAKVLRNAIYKHLAFQTSIAVKIPSAGLETFQLDLHLPFFILNKSTPSESLEKFNTKQRRRWTDLSFLKLDMFDLQAQKPIEVWGIQEAQISCVVAGVDDWRWVGYGFVDTEIDGTLAESSAEDLLHDQIAAGELKANNPIWRPRDYWMRVIEIRSDYARNQWDYLIHKLELGINQYILEHPFTLSQRSEIAQERAAETKEAFDWALQTMHLLRWLDGVLSDTVEAWKSFSSPDGDVGYFRDTDAAAISPGARRSLLAIKATFRQLEGDQKKMAFLNKCCSDFSRALELRLILEGKETADYNWVNSEFAALVLYPIALAAGIFSMEPAVIPFDPDLGTFTLAAFTLVAMSYAMRLVIRHASWLSSWPFLRRTITSWIKIKTLERDYEPLESGFQDRFTPMTGVYADRIMSDEKTNEIGSRALLGD